MREKYIEITWTYYLVHCIYALFLIAGQQKVCSDVFLYAAGIACRHCTLLTVSTELVTGVGTLLLDTVHVNTEVLLTALQGN